jgi:hypothetical protein
MVSKKDIADELGITVDALHLNASRYIMERQAPGSIDANVALTASTTFYVKLGRVPKACVLESVTIRASAIGVGATTTIDILGVPSGTAVTSGTALVTQLAANGLTANTDYDMTVTAANKNLAAGTDIVAKIVTQASETLKPLSVQAVLKL